ncbi:phosphoribosylaminoimidazole-succinocarboxamide synthase [Microscilla marina ATCC 23134]|uniref:Phosphoribosylaminoimidazole-succinocarboxamide synthase n=2 Tax=Microscilla marina TaxID=1027 RepID=A1ZXG2_MICM2|nr:phosphoribosylaminoimidazole-succinocarboxamide synthase [Microscilla marina ATCC 23134]
MQNNTIKETNFHFEGQQNFYRGKVRDVYMFDKHLAVIASDRISAFDVILPEAIPYKGQVLNQISWFFMQQTQDIVPNWIIDCPDPNVAYGYKCTPYPVEMVVRGYLAGSAWRAYKKGVREMNGYKLPEGLKENDPLPQPIITPSTKAAQGEHDEDISSEDIVKKGLVDKKTLDKLEAYTLALFQRGSEIAQKQGLILADTKYEFGHFEGKIYLIDEIHTPDSSRYFNIEGYQERQQQNQPQPQRSKEMVRKWLMENGFNGQEGQKIPEMTPEWIAAVSSEYIALYEQLTNNKFEKSEDTDRYANLQQRISAVI